MKSFSWCASLATMGALAWVFLKIGFLFFGGGYLVIPVMHRELVENLHWLTEREFIDGTAISQLTPGPVAVLATFAGYRVGGVAGALIGTFSAFLPGSLLMLFFSHSYERLRQITPTRKVLNTLVPVVSGLLLAAAWSIGKQAIVGWATAVMFVAALIALIRYRVNPAILIITSAMVGLIFRL